jgi:hypothetical protein
LLLEKVLLKEKEFLLDFKKQLEMSSLAVAVADVNQAANPWDKLVVDLEEALSPYHHRMRSPLSALTRGKSYYEKQEKKSSCARYERLLR